MTSDRAPASRAARFIRGCVGLVLCSSALLATGGGCGGSRYGNFRNVPDRRACSVEISLPTMACGEACPIKVRRALAGVNGVRRVDVDYESRSASVSAVYPACSSKGYESMMESLYMSGYEARIVGSRPLMGWEM